MSSDCEWPLFMTSMAVGLSEHMKMQFMDHSCPLRSVAMMTGYDS